MLYAGCLILELNYLSVDVGSLNLVHTVYMSTFGM
jgi:hypothetical protein